MSKPSKRESNSSKPGEFLPRNIPAFYLDETNDSEELAKGLRAHGFKVHRHREYFSKGTEDERWIPFVIDRGWIILSRDSQWKYNAIEKAAFFNGKARALIISEGKVKMSDSEIIITVCKAKTGISRLVKTIHPPFAARIYKGGKVMMSDF